MPIVAVGAIGVVIAALAALLVLHGAIMLARLVAHLVPDWHIPGLGSIRGFVINAMTGAVRTVSSWIDASVSAVGNFIWAPYHITQQLISRVIALGGDIYNTINVVIGYAWTLARDINKRIGDAYNRLLVVASGWVNALAHFVRVEVARLDNRIGAAYNALLVIASGWVNDLAHFVRVEIARLDNRIGAAYNAAIVQAAAWVNALRAETARDLARVEARADAFAKATATAAVGVLATDIVHPVARAWVDIRDEVKALEGVIATDLPDIGALVKALPRALPTTVDQAITDGIAIDTIVLRYLRECGIPNCKNLGRIGHDLHGLLGIVEGAALLAFLAEMVQHPNTAVTDTVNVLDAPLRDTVGLFQRLVGV